MPLNKTYESLTEGFSANPLKSADAVGDMSVEEQAQSAIMRAVASETDAINQYDQIIALIKKSDKWLSTAALSTLEDVAHEEKKHLGQLTALVSTFPEFKDGIGAGVKEFATGDDTDDSKGGKADQKESITESVVEKVESGQEDRLFSTDDVIDIVFDTLEWTKVGENDFRMYLGDKEEVTAAEIDAALANYGIPPLLLPEIETEIVRLSDPKKERLADFESDLSSDLFMIEELLEKITVVPVKSALVELIDKIKTLKYDGDVETGWNVQHVQPSYKTVNRLVQFDNE